MALSGPDTLLYTQDGPIVTITLNRPERLNAITAELYDRLDASWDRFQSDDSAWVAIVTGAGNRAFSVGADLIEMGAAPPGQWRKGPRRVPVNNWKPVIAAVNGLCLGAAWEQAMRADIRLAAEHAEFGTPEVRYNFLCTFGARAQYLSTVSALCEVGMWAERLSARRAYEVGFVNRVVPAAELLAEARRWAERVCTNGPIAVRTQKELIYRGLTMEWDQLEALGLARWASLRAAEDTREALRAFAEKRKPIWKLR
jgi:enoyl-CoA hydratase/carnithine racemase